MLFRSTSDSAEFVYKCTGFYAPEHEHTLAWDDPEIGIAWPLEPGTRPLLSDKDRGGKRLREAEVYP